LHDWNLLDRLKRVPQQQVAVTIEFDTANPERMMHDFEWVREQLVREVHVIPIQFGPVPQVDQKALDAFLSGTGPTFPFEKGSPAPLQPPG